MSITIIPNKNETIDIKNKSVMVKINYIDDISSNENQNKKLQWELDESSAKIAEFHYSILPVDKHGETTNILRPLSDVKVGDKVIFKITDITDGNNKKQIDTITYIYDDVLLSPLEDPLGLKAYSTFSDIADIGKSGFFLQLTVKVTEAKADGTPGNPKKAAKIYFDTPSSAVQFFSGLDKNTKLKKDNGLGFQVQADPQGVATIYLGATMPGIFNITAAYYSGSSLYKSHVLTQVIFLDTEPGGDLPPLFLPLDIDNVLDLDEYSGNYYPANLPSSLTTNLHFDEERTLGAIVVNDKVVKINTLRKLIEGVSLTKNYINTTTDNTIYYLLTNENGDSFSSSVQNFTAVGSTVLMPDPVILRTLAAPETTASFVNLSATMGDLHLTIPNYTNKAVGDKIYVTVYLDGYKDNTNVKKRDVITYDDIKVNKDNLTAEIPITVANGDLLGYSSNAEGSSGTFQVDYKVIPFASTDTPVYSKILNLPLSTYEKDTINLE
ncbi:protein of unknown function [Xenorhabdus poinarii G6]|uniref:Uncharacterized protein n=1 Tax=Xenorhabdus poinarii G6 TaxID=1354304 RepID=A0A068R7T1_9GAMM|nr:hypothetical protein [Xenorhabdus poinarii]CDG22996.1 protein of unknown function [Xenorhabdus poinarii G6]